MPAVRRADIPSMGMKHLLVAAVGVLTLAACGSDDGDTPTTTVAVQPAVATTVKATTTTVARVGYASCDDARAAGAAPLHRGDPGYSTNLDRDGDGIACE